ncbi:hypothetical protein Phum_PHUM055200 [Pediculus humanus corporis]|uniref:Uncharacterized protein n=1 Tax=Pediculus humanus subsp. corporis TaxID=121224 RepID=E0VB88_PEDHC|nr:uncharacterized protein Phum_PHUM055200 [Pediculus humanus corporis]EEB10644.1 hypothetical protein Phum_PHUM055200 [Pediculus humanus corporis]
MEEEMCGVLTDGSALTRVIFDLNVDSMETFDETLNSGTKEHCKLNAESPGIINSGSCCITIVLIKQESATS